MDVSMEENIRNIKIEQIQNSHVLICDKNTDILKCASVQRIHQLLENQNIFLFLNFTPINQLLREYTATDCVEQLLDDYNFHSLFNDFTHIKSQHNIQNDDHSFAKLYDLFTDKCSQSCDIKRCAAVKSRFKDRLALQHGLKDITEKSHIDLVTTIYENKYNTIIQSYIDLINRIHTFFMHSYDMNRFSKNELDN
eukprot:371198_1